jgi:multidrug resistance efflux pump
MTTMQQDMAPPDAAPQNGKTQANGSGIPATTAAPPWYRQANAVRTFQAVLVITVLGIVYWLFWVHPYVYTDDARVDATLARVAPEGAGGRVIAVHVTEGDAVKAGDPLVELDPQTAQAELQRARAKALVARKDLARARELAAERGVSARQLDLATAASESADAEERLAELALDRCTLRSPFNGVVVQKVAYEGNRFDTGQTAVTVADLDHAWVAANVEETDAGSLKPGQEARIWIDEGGSLTGRLLEVRQATLSTFSLIPSENSSGNFVKLVQRIPLKIALDPHPGRVLRVGQSVVVKIRVH